MLLIKKFYQTLYSVDIPTESEMGKMREKEFIGYFVRKDEKE